MYRYIRPLLFSLDEERAHALTLRMLHYVPEAFFVKPHSKIIRVMGLEFPHLLGLAAGLDKNGEHLDALAKLGFAYIEIGTVTPRPQVGQAKPRLFRLPDAHALINRMGFNNQGVEAMITHLKKTSYQGILGINIGKNKDTSLNDATEDYMYCLRQLYPFADYMTLNISSPNTQNLRELQQADYFYDLVHDVCQARQALMDKYQRYVPLLIKVSPDESDETLKHMANTMMTVGMDGIIATNTTCSRRGIEHVTRAEEIGGLSGAPLLTQSTHCLRVLKAVVGDAMTLIGVGGISDIASAQAKLDAGASLLQVYTGLIYQGPSLIEKLTQKHVFHL